ncbi:hypothetical protein V6N13_119520 [Hibiscus sabdariffa]
MQSSSSICHIVAVPYPGRGHVNPMMNLCKLLCSKTPNILITFVNCYHRRVVATFLCIIEQGSELVDYIPGLTPTRLADLPTIFHVNDQQVLSLVLDCVSSMPKARYLLFTSVYELESRVIDAFKETLPFPVYAIGPSVPYLDLEEPSC